MANAVWTSVTLKGQSHRIPATCPNCLSPGTESRRYAWKGPIPFLNTTKYFQTFTYCAPCAAAVDGYLSRRKKTGILSVVAGLAAGVGGMILFSLLAGPDGPLHGRFDEQAMITGGMVLGGAMLVGAWLLVRVLMQPYRGSPPAAGAAVNGPAAWYAGDSAFGLGLSCVYRAARPEWLRALVLENPTVVADDVYLRVTGEAKPAPDRPFPG